MAQRKPYNGKPHETTPYIRFGEEVNIFLFKFLNYLTENVTLDHQYWKVLNKHQNSKDH